MRSPCIILTPFRLSTVPKICLGTSWRDSGTKPPDLPDFWMQEVVADNRTALEAVVAADVELMKLRAEEAELTARMNDASLDEGAAEPSSDQRADDEADRLTAVYDRMQVLLAAWSYKPSSKA